MAKLFFSAIYCLFGLALISMGISLMQEQVMAKASWLAGEVGMKETEDDRIEKYILTKFPDAKFTPIGKGGLKLDFGPSSVKNEQVITVYPDDDDDESTTDSSSNDDDDSLSLSDTDSD